MAASAGLRCRDDRINLDELFEEELQSFQEASTKGDPDEMHEAIDNLCAAIEVFEERVMLPGLDKLDGKCIRTLNPWATRRLELQTKIYDAILWIMKEYPEREEFPNVLRLRPLPGIPDGQAKDSTKRKNTKKAEVPTGQSIELETVAPEKTGQEQTTQVAELESRRPKPH